MNLNKMISYMDVAEAIMRKSKDPSTQVGAVALDDECGLICAGYNGFSRGVKDLPERLEDRSLKYPLTVHAEANLIAQAARKGLRLEGATVVVTSLYPCSQCASLMAQAGVKRIITTRPDNERWNESAKLADIVFNEAAQGIEVVEVEKVNGQWVTTQNYKDKKTKELMDMLHTVPTMAFNVAFNND